MRRGAVISSCGVYRYSLSREWDEGEGRALWVMLNPSTADGEDDDPTIRRLIGFSKKWGLRGLDVVNLFAFRATDPGELAVAADPIGPDNNAAFAAAFDQTPVAVVAAWGGGVDKVGIAPGRARSEAVAVALSRRADVLCFGLTRDGHPRHPLYLKRDTMPAVWIPRKVEPAPSRPEHCRGCGDLTVLHCGTCPDGHYLCPACFSDATKHHRLCRVKK